MLPGRDRLLEIARAPNGSFAEVPYAVLLAALAVAKRDCVAVLERRRTEKRIVFLGGVPADCRSNLLNETFGRFLVAQGKIPEEQFALVQAQCDARKVRFGEVLVERGLATPEEVNRLLQQNLARKLLDAFTWHEGSWRLVPDPPAVDSPPKLHAGQLILTGVSRFAPQAAIDAAIGTLIGKKLALAPEPPFPLSDIRLTESQTRVVAALEKRPRIDELAVTAGLPFEEITRILYALWLLGAVVPAEQAPVVPRPAAPPAAAPATVAVPSPPIDRPAAPAPSAAASDVLRDAMRRDWEGFRGRDAFDLLGAPEDADEPAALARFLEKARAWAPWQFAGEDAEKATALLAAAARAYARLADPDSRAAARAARRRPAEPAKAASQVFAIRTDLLDPEAQHRKGADLLAAGRHAQALSFLEFAADCDPQNGSYAADVSWCRYLISGKSTGATTLAELDEAIRIDAKSGIACFYAGEICRARSDAARAEGYYRKAAKLMAPDRRPLDALRDMARSSTR